MWFCFWKMHRFLHLRFFLRERPLANHHQKIIYSWAYSEVRSACHLHIRFKILKSIYHPNVFFHEDSLMQFGYFEVIEQKNPELISASFWAFLYRLEISVHKQKLADTEKCRYVPALRELLRRLESLFSQSPEQMWKHFITFRIQNIWKSASSVKP